MPPLLKREGVHPEGAEGRVLYNQSSGYSLNGEE